MFQPHAVVFLSELWKVCGRIYSGFRSQIKAESRSFASCVGVSELMAWHVCVCVLGACIDFASVVSGHQGHVAHASSNLHCGRRMRNSLIRNNSQILFMLTPVLIMAKQSAFFRGSWASIWCNWILLKLVCLVELCTGLWAFGCMVVFLIFTGILLTLERRNGKLNLACPQGFCWLRIPTHIAANTHAHIFVGLLSRKGVNHEPASQHCHWLPQQASPLVY